MAKLAPGIRLLRTLTRTSKLQRAAARGILAALTPKPARKKAAGKPRPKSRQLPPSPPAPGKWLLQNFPLPIQPGHAAVRHMPAWLYLPQKVPESVTREGWPLIVMLHGCYQSATQFAQGTRMNRLAEDKGFALLYPQQLAGVQSHRCWRWYERETQHGGGDTASLIALLANVCERQPINRRRIYACGISAGAGMAAILALTHPELFAAVGLHSGPVFGAGHSKVGALHVMRNGAPLHADAVIRQLLERRALRRQAAGHDMPPMPAVLIQGEDDRVLHPVNQRQLARQWLQVNGLPHNAAARLTTKPATRSGTRNAYVMRDYLAGRKVLLRVISIAGLGHAWSGGDPALKFNAAAGPDASRMTLDFFRMHRR